MNRSSTRKPRPATRFRPRIASLEGRLLLSADILTYHNDNARDGLNANETILTPQNVNAATFGLVGFDATDGKVDAEPLSMANVTIPGQGTHNVLFVATERDSVYAFDADTGATLWRVSMLGPGEVPSDPVYGNQVTPEIGVTATPVIDPNTGTMYVVAMSKRVSAGNTTYIQRIHALDVTTGADVMTPTTIGGPTNPITFPGQGPGGDGTNLFFDPKQYKERNALLLVNGVVVTSWASHSDLAPYTSWVISFNASDLSLSSIINLNPNGVPNSRFLGDGSGNAFWNSGGGPAADDVGNFYNITGNGPFDENLDANGFPQSQDYGDSYIKFSTDGGLAVSDYFTPFNQQQLADTDRDIGSSGITLLPDMQDSGGNTVQLAIGSGKDGNIYLVDRNNMGKFRTGDNGNIYQELPGAVGGAEFATPAYFNGQVYFGGVGATIRAYQFSDARLQTTQASQTSNSFGYPGATPSISADGTTNGILWAVANTNPAVLFAYDANNLANKLYDSNQAPNGRDRFGAGNKFITPMIANGKVFVATTNGVGVFGLLPNASLPTVDTPAAASPHPVEGSTTIPSVLGADVNLSGSQLANTWTATVVPPSAPEPTFRDDGTNTAKNTTATFSHHAGTATFEVPIETSNSLTTTSDVTVSVGNGWRRSGHRTRG